MTKSLSTDQTEFFIKNLENSDWVYEYNAAKHRLEIKLEPADVHLRLPVNKSWPLDDDNPDFGYVILLIQSGKAAVAYCDDDYMIDHKVFKSYMVRQKQGKSQIKYLNAKGKSRAGSRVRLANTVHFFESINERLQEYFEDYEINRIALSCSKTLLPYLYKSKVKCPFTKDDERLYKIPKHIHTPSYEILEETLDWMLKAEIHYEESQEEEVLDLIDEDYGS